MLSFSAVHCASSLFEPCSSVVHHINSLSSTDMPGRSVLQSHLNWRIGEPAVAQYWLKGAALSRSTAALQAEDGVSQVRMICCSKPAFCLQHPSSHEAFAGAPFAT